MQLIGLLDSPYVRCTAISLQLLNLPFVHRPLSVFRNFDEFHAINPVVKAPTLICDDGTVLLDSTLMLDYAETLATPERLLMPVEPQQRLVALRVIGLALATCEKSIQIIYEQQKRPLEYQYEPWLERARGQLLAACDLLEAELQKQPLATDSASINQAGITVGVTWHFLQQEVPEVVKAENYPALQAFSALVEALPEFKAAPHGMEGMKQ
jgi:glutathione S-transferase